MKLPVLDRNAQLDAIKANYNTGYIRIYSGTKPTDGDTALSGNTLLAELRFSATAFPAASAGVLTANAITQDTLADNTGTASFARLFRSDGTTAAGDLTVGTSGTEIVLPTTSIVQNAAVALSSLTISQPLGA